MKLLKLHINSHKHLENVTFDFTYQSGKRKGQPLDKICFIGQGATGKTSLLEIIYIFNQYIINLEVINNNTLFENIDSLKKLDGGISFQIDDEIINYENGEIYYREKFLKNSGGSGTLTPLLEANFKRNAYYFKSNLISDYNLSVFTNNPIDLFEKYSELANINIKNIHLGYDYSTLFDDVVEPRTWLLLLFEILDYRKKFNQKMSDLIHKGLLANPTKLSKEFSDWQKENPNSLEAFAEKFNPILSKLNLEVDIVDTQYSIPIKNKNNDEIVPIQDTSTGTKGLLLSFLPLYKLQTKDSIILIDEPERSLYPDLQMDLMEHYKNFAPEAQFIVATHSPFIAASFEPDERFILSFDQQGKVVVNRGSSPIGDDPNDILKNDFGIDYNNQYGKDAYKKYLKLKEDLVNEKNLDKKKEILLETVRLGDTYNF